MSREKDVFVEREDGEQVKLGTGEIAILGGSAVIDLDSTAAGIRLTGPDEQK